jgi:two-component system sensor histidine kinase TctE
VPYSALEAFEADNQSRMYYKVSNLAGELVSGYDRLCPVGGRIPDKPAYAALVDFYDDTYRGEPVRVAVLLQPVARQRPGMAVIQVAETLELRRTLARRCCGHAVAPGFAGRRDCRWWSWSWCSAPRGRCGS